MKLESGKFYSQTLVFYIACLLGMMIFAGVTVFLNRQNGAIGEAPYGIWVWIAGSIGLMGILSSDFVYSWFTKRLTSQGSWEFRSQHLRTALIIRFVLLEITAMVAGVAFLISGDNYALAVMIVIIAYTIYRRPTREQIIAQVHASKEEEEWI